MITTQTPTLNRTPLSTQRNPQTRPILIRPLIAIMLIQLILAIHPPLTPLHPSLHLHLSPQLQSHIAASRERVRRRGRRRTMDDFVVAGVEGAGDCDGVDDLCDDVSRCRGCGKVKEVSGKAAYRRGLRGVVCVFPRGSHALV